MFEVAEAYERQRGATDRLAELDFELPLAGGDDARPARDAGRRRRRCCGGYDLGPLAGYPDLMAAPGSAGAARVPHRQHRRRPPAARAGLRRRRLQDQPARRRAADHLALPARGDGRGDAAHPLRAAGAALLRGPAPLPALAAARLRPGPAHRARCSTCSSAAWRARTARPAPGVFSWTPPPGAGRPSCPTCWRGARDPRPRRRPAARVRRGRRPRRAPTCTSRCGWPGSAASSARPVLLAAALAVRGVRAGSVCVELATRRRLGGARRGRPAGRADLAARTGRRWTTARWSPSARTRRGGRCGWSTGCSTSTGTGSRSSRSAASSTSAPPGPRRRSTSRRCRHCSTGRPPTCSGWPPRWPPGAGSASSPAGRARARRTRSPGCSGCCSTSPARRPRIALAAPTGKAAARLQESVLEQAAAVGLPLDLTAQTLHRLLGWRPDSSSRFRHDAAQPAALRRRRRRRVVDGVADDDGAAARGAPADRAARARGRPRPAHAGRRRRGAQRPGAPARTARRRRTASRGGGRRRQPTSTTRTAGSCATASCGCGCRSATAPASPGWPRRCAPGTPTASWSCWTPATDLDARLRHRGARGARSAPSPPSMRAAAEVGDAERCLELLGRHRLLCAHRHGPFGVSAWNDRIGRVTGAAPGEWGARAAAARHRERLREQALERRHRRRRPDAGRSAGGVPAGERCRISCRSRGCSAVSPAHALTVHRSQGSQFEAVTVLLPPAGVAAAHPGAALHGGDPCQPERAGRRLGGGGARGGRRQVVRASGLRRRSAPPG